MRQAAIYYRQQGAKQFARLDPENETHRGLYERGEIGAAADLLRHYSFIEGIAIRIGDEAFNLVKFSQDAVAPLSRSLEEPWDFGGFFNLVKKSELPDVADGLESEQPASSDL